MSTINVGGGYESSSKSSQYWTLRDRLRNLTTALSGDAAIDLRFDRGYFLKENSQNNPELAAGIELFDATCTRGSKGWYPEWDFTNGGECGRLTEYGNNELRYGAVGLLEEPASTNHIRNPRFEGAVAGTPGTMPTHMSATFNTADFSVVGSGYESGFPYLDVEVGGIPSTIGLLFLEELGHIAAGQGDNLSLHAGIRLLSGDQKGLESVRLVTQERDGSNGIVAGTQFIVSALETDHRRYVHQRTVSSASTATVFPYLQFNYESWVGDEVLNEDFTSYADQAAAEAAGYSSSDASLTFDAANDQWDWAGTTAAALELSAGTHGMTVGETYIVEVVISGSTAGTLDIRHPATTIIKNLTTGGVAGTFRAYVTAQAATIRLVSNATFDGSIDSITIKRAMPAKTLRIYAPQLEKQAEPTSLILPPLGSPAASTRATETVTKAFDIARASRKTALSVSGRLTDFRDDVPAITDKGLLVEGSATNYATFPLENSGWRTNTSSNLIDTYDDHPSLVALDGRKMALIRAEWSANSATPFNNLGSTTGTAGQVWVAEMDLAGANGDSSAAFGILSDVGGWGDLADVSTEIISGPGTLAVSNGSLTRVTGLSQTQVTRVRVSRTLTASQSVNLFVYPVDSTAMESAETRSVAVGAPQLTQGVSSYIPTTSAAATRVADDISIPLANIPGFDPAQPFTVLVEANIATEESTSFPRLFSFNDGTQTNVIDCYLATSNRLVGFVLNGNTIQVSNTGGAPNVYTPGNTVRIAFRVEDNNFGQSTDGNTTTVDANCTMPTPTSLIIGTDNIGGARFSNAYHRRLIIVPRAYSDAELEEWSAS